LSRRRHALAAGAGKIVETDDVIELQLVVIADPRRNLDCRSRFSEAAKLVVATVLEALTLVNGTS